jgi:hypothetical protein
MKGCSFHPSIAKQLPFNLYTLGSHLHLQPFVDSEEVQLHLIPTPTSCCPFAVPLHNTEYTLQISR